MSGWIKIPDNWIDTTEIEALSSDAVAFHLSALSYSCHHLTEGRIPRRAFRKLWPVDDSAGVAAELIGAGLWEESGLDIVQIVGWETNLLSNEQLNRRKEVQAKSSERLRKHKDGDHSMCDRCEFIREQLRLEGEARGLRNAALDIREEIPRPLEVPDAEHFDEASADYGYAVADEHTSDALIRRANGIKERLA